MPDHEFVVAEENQTFVQFSCNKCGVVINFVHAEYGTPNPTRDEANTTWLPPSNVGDYLPDCTG